MSELAEIDNSPSAIRVGDLIQYRYQWRELGGLSDHALSTRKVKEVIQSTFGDGPIAFIVEGGFQVEVAQITAHIPMHSESDGTKQEQEASL
jgi:hypothetical protein